MAEYITVKDENTECGIYEFTREITTQNAEEFCINIFASQRYILYINDEYICEGPCRGTEEIQYYDEVKTDKIVCGKNVIKVVVLHISKNKHFSTVFKRNKPILIISAKSKNFFFETDNTWNCKLINNHKLFYPKGYMTFLPPFEEITDDGLYTDCEIECVGNFDFKKGFFASYGIKDFFNMKKREIPMIYPMEEIKFNVVKSGDGFIELDAGEYKTAKIFAKIAPNSDVKIIYSECYVNNGKKRKRDDSSGNLNGNYDIVHTKNNEFDYNSYWFRAFRYIRIESKNPQRDVLELKAKVCHYPLNILGEFECSKESYNKMYKISVNTMLCCMHEIFVDCPHYEQQQYIMDSAIEASVLMRMSDDVRPVKKCISEFAASQHEDGNLSANYPCGYTQIIPGFSFFWIFLLRDYLEYSLDVDFVRKYTSVMDKILNCFDEQVRNNKYIVKSVWWDFVDWVPEWNMGEVNTEADEAITIYNMYYACALKDAAFICKKVGRIGLSTEYQKRYEEIKNIINTYCYDEKRGLYRDGSKLSEFSMHCVIWSVLCELVTGDDAKRMMKHIFDSDLKKSSFSMNYYLFRALEKCGCYDEYAFDILKQWEKMVDLNCTTWCENPDSPRSECHGWSSAPLYEFSANVLGVKYSTENEITIVPKTGNLTYAKGTVPTRYGKIYVEWHNKNGEFNIIVKSSENLKKKLILPNGEVVEFCDTCKTIKANVKIDAL